MGKVSLFLIVIGLVALAPAVILTIIQVVSPVFISNRSNIGYDWLSSIVIAFVIGVLYVVAFGFQVFFPMRNPHEAPYKTKIATPKIIAPESAKCANKSANINNGNISIINNTSVCLESKKCLLLRL
jgi:uncharacterized membrane protein